ncbi:hypothetical protein KQI84_03910 [bacterium]|nr:hypothetical protein [bacterium]
MDLAERLIFLIIGVAIGISLSGISAKLTKVVKGQKNKKAKKGKQQETKYRPPSDPATQEIFTTYIDKVDVDRGMTISVSSHLRDVVEESATTGRFGHQLRLVIKQFDGQGPLDQIDELVRHCVKVHRDCPHLPFWLDGETIELYLGLVYRGHQVIADEEDEDKAIVSWGQLQDDIATRSPAAITRDIGDAPEGTVMRLVGEGMVRIRSIIGKLDPMHQEEPEEAEAQSI